MSGLRIKLSVTEFIEHIKAKPNPQNLNATETL